MILSFKKTRSSLSYRIFTAFITLTFITNFFPRGVSAQMLLDLPVPGTMVMPSASFTPPLVAGITIYPDNPLKVDFIIDTGDDNLQGEALAAESKKLINYFLATLTVPEDEMWVNLSPYEKDRIIADGLSATEMGRDMLVQDYMLKQLTASLMYPEEDLGAEFWKRIYEKTQAKFGTTEIPANTFNKIWIVPQEAVVYVNGTNVFVSESHLSVMLEEDYLSLDTNVQNKKHGLGDITRDKVDVMSEEASNIVREVLIPEIEKEVNHGKNFANLRQIYNSMILATWYKKNLKKGVLGNVYVDSNKVSGIDLEDKQIKEKIYNQYLEAFKKGVYNYIKEDYDPATQQMIPRKYFSGGLERVQNIVEDNAMVSQEVLARQQERYAQGNPLQRFGIGFDLLGTDGVDFAMVATGQVYRPASVGHGLYLMMTELKDHPVTAADLIEKQKVSMTSVLGQLDGLVALHLAAKQRGWNGIDEYILTSAVQDLSQEQLEELLTQKFQSGSAPLGWRNKIRASEASGMSAELAQWLREIRTQGRIASQKQQSPGPSRAGGIESIGDVRPGQTVWHPKFGVGTVSTIRKQAAEILVKFDETPSADYVFSDLRKIKAFRSKDALAQFLSQSDGQNASREKLSLDLVNYRQFIRREEFQKDKGIISPAFRGVLPRSRRNQQILRELVAKAKGRSLEHGRTLEGMSIWERAWVINAETGKGSFSLGDSKTDEVSLDALKFFVNRVFDSQKGLFQPSEVVNYVNWFRDYLKRKQGKETLVGNIIQTSNKVNRDSYIANRGAQLVTSLERLARALGLVEIEGQMSEQEIASWAGVREVQVKNEILTYLARLRPGTLPYELVQFVKKTEQARRALAGSLTVVQRVRQDWTDGRAVSQKHYKNSEDPAKRSIYSRGMKVFGSWAMALEVAGIPEAFIHRGTGSARAGSRMSKEQVVQAIEARAARGGSLDYLAVVEQEPGLLNGAWNHYDSWPEVVRQITGQDVTPPALAELSMEKVQAAARSRSPKQKLITIQDIQQATAAYNRGLTAGQPQAALEESSEVDAEQGISASFEQGTPGTYRLSYHPSLTNRPEQILLLALEDVSIPQPLLESYLRYFGIVVAEQEQDAEDNAMVAKPGEGKYGGIDFNAGTMKLKQSGETSGIDFTTDLDNIQPGAVQGVMPVIINVTPITNFAPLLGALESEGESQAT